MTSGGRKPRQPSATERELWRQVTRDARPLPGRKSDSAFTQTLREEIGGAPADAQESQQSEPASPPAPSPRPSAAAPAAKKPAPPLAPGRFADLDKRTADRLRRGRMPLEAALDLHGMTQEAAHLALDSFISRAFESGLRCVVVVTGKGSRSAEEGGVLRRRVPVWLNQPVNRTKLLAFTHAQPRHGGEGALYVLLKRRRG
jgi:DNA-nicking Smr family endonuclease